MSQIMGGGDTPRFDPAKGSLSPDDLPPVEPPSAGFIVQLFVIPAAIVAVIVVVWLLFGKLAGGERDPMDYVQTIKTDGPRRSRAAYELGTLIHNDPQLAARNEVLLGELTDLLNQELEKKGSDPEVQRYLALTLGTFQTLDARLVAGKKVDPLAALARALAPEHDSKVRQAAAESLARQAARLEETLDDPGSIQALTEAGQEKEPPDLRQKAVFALGFFGGDAAIAALRQFARAADPFVRFNAGLALARRGDLAALPVAREMLTHKDLERTVKLDSPTETRNKIEGIEIQTLKALETAVSRKQTELALQLRPEIQSQTKSGLVGVRTEAAALLKRLPAESAQPVKSSASAAR